ncbi:SDR family oxidoreductase [Pseudonocardia oroxyli]|uniref:Short-chain dehydrogenase n=1 Tax=Pseudonocardia oroxyli TaxID=366584 RepID=A0A1G7THE7_PSEOR|nr:SDR family NAD(P)-dependent oxidoreductase [Pseudonocardia oroxyli]SDG34743.1 Short-chain dehydrogenase [Pseudonocardia oroxyli]
MTASGAPAADSVGAAPTAPYGGFFQESVTVVTGAGNGIGRATALALALAGAHVVASDVDLPAAEETTRSIEDSGHQAWARRVDVTSTEDYAAVRDFCLDTWGRVDRVMNNAGLASTGLPEDLPLAEWRRIIDVNLLGIVRSNEIFLPVLTRQGHGQLVNTASTSGMFPYAYDRLPYAATKAAVIAMTEGLALYLRPQGIGVHCVCPAGVRTSMPSRMPHFGPERRMGVPALPVVDPDDMAATILAGLAEDRFLICSVPEAYAEFARRGADPQAYLDGAVERFGYGR